MSSDPATSAARALAQCHASWRPCHLHAEMPLLNVPSHTETKAPVVCRHEGGVEHLRSSFPSRLGALAAIADQPVRPIHIPTRRASPRASRMLSLRPWLAALVRVAHCPFREVDVAASYALPRPLGWRSFPLQRGWARHVCMIHHRLVSHWRSPHWQHRRSSWHRWWHPRTYHSLWGTLQIFGRQTRFRHLAITHVAKEAVRPVLVAAARAYPRLLRGFRLPTTSISRGTTFPHVAMRASGIVKVATLLAYPIVAILLVLHLHGWLREASPKCIHRSLHPLLQRCSP
mmetsp:Transcript_66887/g.160139  ORF Transcript_66887/g.160139 Transcript_66887/m.160139 type:complete len:287 (-) Transcript_66887:92-952(-)